MTSLTTGTKFWRVRSQHGYIGSTEAYTAWSATGTFTVLATPLRMGAVTFPSPKFSGGEARGSVEITGAAPAGGATVTLTTSHPSLLPELPSSAFITAGESSANVLVAPTGFPNSLRGMRVGFVTTPTPVTVTATYNGTSASTTITLLPPKLNDTPFQLFPVKATGGAAHGRDRGPGDRLLRRLLRRAGSSGRLPGEPVELVAGRDRAGVDHHSRGSRWHRVPDRDESRSRR